jgi:hypothetical protein
MASWEEVVTTALIGTDRRPLPGGPTPWSSVVTDRRGGDGDKDRHWDDPAAAAHHQNDRFGEDAAVQVLELAAAHFVTTQAAAPLVSCPAPSMGPAQSLPLAPKAALVLLARLLAQPQVGLVNAWLSVSADRGLGASPDLWPRMARLASTNPAYDRALLGRVLGDRGLWLLGQNPEWAGLLATDGPRRRPVTNPDLQPRAAHPEELDERSFAALAVRDGAGAARAALAQQNEVWAEALVDAGYEGPGWDELTALVPAARRRALAASWAREVRDPVRALRMILACPDPLSAELVSAAFRLLATGKIGSYARSASLRLAYRMPLTGSWNLEQLSGGVSKGEAGDAASSSREVQLSFAWIEHIVRARTEILQSFQDTPVHDDCSA